MTRLRIDPDVLLAGPRGRRVCWALLTGLAGGHWLAESAGAQVVADALASGDIGAIADARAPTAFLDALDEAVSAAMYFEEPDDCDRWLAPPEMGAALRPVADAVGVAAAAR